MKNDPYRVAMNQPSEVPGQRGMPPNSSNTAANGKTAIIQIAARYPAHQSTNLRWAMQPSPIPEDHIRSSVVCNTGLRAGADWQRFQRAHARPLAPPQLLLVDGERQLRPAAKERLQRAGALDAGELVAEAEMDAGAEGEVAVRPAIEREALGIGIGVRVGVGGDQHGHDP